MIYDSLRADDPGDFLASGSCVEQDDGSDTLAVDLSLPVAGKVLFYLVRAHHACPRGDGTFGTDSSGHLRIGPDCP